jgi:hypothetical protein
MELLVTVGTVALVIGGMLLLSARRSGREAPARMRSGPPDLSDEVPGVPRKIRDEIEAKVAEDFPPTAVVVHSADALTALLAEKLPAWPWAAFASVLVQRRNALQDRLRDNRLEFTIPTGESARTDNDVVRFVMDRMSDLTSLTDQLEQFMLSAAFRDLVSTIGDDDDADAGDVLHTANRLMDIHDRFLELAERCRGVQVPSEHTALMRDCARLASVPLEGYRKFIDDFTALIAKVPGWLHYSDGDVDAGQIVLAIDMDDDELLDRIFTQVRRVMNK